MQSRAAKPLRKYFDQQMRLQFPDALLVAKDPGWLYRWDLGNEISAFVALIIAPKDDRFTLEVAWSRTGSFPINILCKMPFGNPAAGRPPDPPEQGSMRFRISEFWKPGMGEWWYLAGEKPDVLKSIELFDRDWREAIKLPEYTNDQIHGMADKALSSIRQYVIPYFQELATTSTI
jgi:hypothetical protein